MVSIVYRLGPSRPNKPNQKILTIVENAVRQVLGDAATVVITSGREDDGQQYGSDRHKTGDAADVAIYTSEQRRIRATDPEALAIAKAAAENGAKGIGWGATYMNGRNFHIDAVEPKEGQANTWGDEGVRYRDEIVAIINKQKQTPIRDDDIETPAYAKTFLDDYATAVNTSPFQTNITTDTRYDFEELEKSFVSVYDIASATETNQYRPIEIENLLLIGLKNG